MRIWPGVRSTCDERQGKVASSCAQEPPLLRFIIAFSAGATLLYTPLLKRMTGIKNISVAAVIALSPVAGALAAGAVRCCIPDANVTAVILRTGRRLRLMNLHFCVRFVT